MQMQLYLGIIFNNDRVKTRTYVLEPDVLSLIKTNQMRNKHKLILMTVVRSSLIVLFLSCETSSKKKKEKRNPPIDTSKRKHGFVIAVGRYSRRWRYEIRFLK